ncbi:MAG: hypothetical protein ACI8RZ_005197 [Myxococcota bacterium]|jgi:hypothetical protein
MPLPRSRTRSIPIGAAVYQWLASMHWAFEVSPDGRQWKKNPKFVDLHVALEDGGIGVLHARFPVPVLAEWGWQVREHRRALPDDLVARTIRYALKDGWLPGETDFNLPLRRVRYLRTLRHMLYTEPIIARIRVLEAKPTGRDSSTVHASIIHPIRGRPGNEFHFTVPLTASHIPDQALVFLHPEGDGLTTWHHYAGVFRISGSQVLIYDNSGGEHRWGFRPLTSVLEELGGLGWGEE